MANYLKERLTTNWEMYTIAEQKIATYILENLDGIPFESAASLSKCIGISPMTLGRFLKKLGYAGVGAMKRELRREDAWLKLYRGPPRSSDATSGATKLEAEVRMLSKVYSLRHGDEWQPIVQYLISSKRISVASFEQTYFLGMALATLLQYVRPHVAFARGVDGAYLDVLVDSADSDCVVLIDQRRYSKHFRILAEEVVRHRIPLVIITDTQCYWARELTPNVLMVPGSGVRAWHDFSAFSILFSMLIDDVINGSGTDVYERISEVNDLRCKFVGFSGAARRRRHSASSE